MDGGQQWARVRSDGGRGDKRVIHNIIWMCLKSARNVYIRDRNVYFVPYLVITKHGTYSGGCVSPCKLAK